MTQLHEVARMLAPKFPQVAELLENAVEDVLAICTSHENTAADSTRPTRSSVCTKRSSAAPASSGSSRPGTR